MNNTFQHNVKGRGRRGAILVLVALLIPVLVAVLAFAVDTGGVVLVRTELQRSADAAALAGVIELEPGVKPLFPLKSPLEVRVGVPNVLAASLQRDMTTTAGVFGANISVIDPGADAGVGRAVDVARRFAEGNRVSGVTAFSQRPEDVTVFHYESALASPPLLPLPPLLRGLGAGLESLLLVPPDTSAANAVRVTTRCDGTANGPAKLHFAPLIGTDAINVHATATAARLKGYGVRPGAKMLPLAMDVTVWRALRLGNGLVNGVPIAQELLGAGRPVILVDEQAWDRRTRQVTHAADGIWEVLLLGQPLHTVNLPGITNYLAGVLGLPVVGNLLGGTLNAVLETPATVVALNLAGGSGTPTRIDLARQIRDGVSQADVGDRLLLPFTRYGDESVPSDVFGDLNAVVGQQRIIPLFETVTGTVINKVTGILGAKKKYKIIGFGGVIVTEVRDLGVVKYIKIQPATVSSQYVLKAQPGQVQSYSDCVYTCPVMIE